MHGPDPTDEEERKGGIFPGTSQLFELFFHWYMSEFGLEFKVCGNGSGKNPTMQKTFDRNSSITNLHFEPQPDAVPKFT